MATYLLSSSQREYLTKLADLFEQGLSAEWAFNRGFDGEIRSVLALGTPHIQVPKPTWRDLEAFADAELLVIQRDGSGKIVDFRWRIERVIDAVKNDFEIHRSLVKGDEINTINIERNYGIAAIKSRFDNTVFIIDASLTLSSDMKDELKSLYSQLTQELNAVRKDHPAENEVAETIEKYAGDVAVAVAAEKPNRTLLKMSAEGLIKASETIAKIAPNVVTTAAKIAVALAPLIGSIGS